MKQLCQMGKEVSSCRGRKFPVFLCVQPAETGSADHMAESPRSCRLGLQNGRIAEDDGT